MIDHLTLGVADAEASRRFYDAACAPLGLRHGRHEPYEWWGALTLATDGRPVSTGVHVAFAAASSEAVDAFHAAAVAAGGSDNGPPGLRPDYGADYYAAFVHDPDGTNVEAVFRGTPPVSGLDHVSVGTADLDAAVAFYETVLASLGHGVLRSFDDAVGFGVRGATLWLARKEASRDAHLAFSASSPTEVDAFWQAGRDAGYADNGAPGPRLQYHPGYYGAFLLDPDGRNVEAVHHGDR
jgi:catechol 2,3-dioxygenase-like lactoylglutathione lyase family enzyme